MSAFKWKGFYSLAVIYSWPEKEEILLIIFRNCLIFAILIAYHGGLHPDVAIADVIHKISNYELSNGVKHENERQLKTCVIVKQTGNGC